MRWRTPPPAVMSCDVGGVGSCGTAAAVGGGADVLALLHVNKAELVARQHTRHEERLSQV